MNIIAPSAVDFDAYFAEHQVDAAKVRPASSWTDAVIDRFYGQGKSSNWTALGFDKMFGKFDMREGEVTIWAGVNGHGKSTFLNHVMLNVMQAGQKVCIASLEMKPRDTMAKMTQQASGAGEPAIPYIRQFGRWTDDRLWVYDQLGRIAPSRALAIATYARKELKIDHIVIDSLMKCGLGTDDYTAQKDFVDELCAIARDTGLHIHLVCHMRKGENERMAPNKFDVKGAGEITDLVDNLVIVWKNVRKSEAKEGAIEKNDPDAFVRVAKQRHHAWEGSFAFWFNPETQQFREHEHERARYLDLAIDDYRTAA